MKKDFKKDYLINELNKKVAELQKSKKECEYLLRELQESQQNLNAVLKYVPDAIGIAEAPGVIMKAVSRYGLSLFGREHGITGLNLLEFFDGWKIFGADGTKLDYDDFPLVRAIKHGEVTINRELIVRRPDGTEIFLIVNAGPIYDEQGEIKAGIVVWRNVTEIVMARKELETMNLDLSNTSRKLTKVLSGMLPICASCKKIKDRRGKWISFEKFVEERSKAELKLDLCPECEKEVQKEKKIV